MKIAVAGTGKAAQDFLQAASQLEEIEITAICHHSPDSARAEELAAAFGIPSIFGDYAGMLGSADADFIYIAFVNSAHYECAAAALDAGLNVIVEKPLCVTSQQARELANVAWKKDLFLFEAMTTLHQQNYKGIRDSIRGIGNICMVQCNFSQRSSRYDRYLAGRIDPVFDPKQFGGALYDLNVYNLSFVIDLFGRPQDVLYLANLGHNGVDLSGTLLMQYPTFHAVCTAAKDSTSPGHVIVQGDRGYISVEGNPNELPRIELNVNGRSGIYRLNRFEHRMMQELADFEQAWKDKDRTRARYWLETSIAVIETLERAAESAELNLPRS